MRNGVNRGRSNLKITFCCTSFTQGLTARDQRHSWGSQRYLAGECAKLRVQSTVPTGEGYILHSKNIEVALNGGPAIAAALGGVTPNSPELIQLMPAAIYVTDAAGRITFYNEAAASLWGCRPELGKSEFCGSWKLFYPDGRPMAHDECPMAMTLREARPIRGSEAIAERPDGTRVAFVAYPTPLFDAAGQLTGAINMLVDVSDMKGAESSISRHRNEQAALYEYTDRLLRAESLDDVCSAALDAIERALGCKRSSILLLDDTGVMRFKAWRDLSDNYRRAVEGHSPWAQDVTDPEPICVPDVASAGLEPGLTSVLDAEGLRALAFFPLVSKGALIGKFMTYNEMPHVYGESEVRLALNIARQLAFSVEKMRSEEARRQAENDLHDFFENGSIAMHWVGPDGIILRANRYELRMLGYESHEYIGRPIADFHASLDTIADILQRLSGGEALEGYEAQLRCKDGTIKDVQITSSVLRDSTGRFIHTRCFTQDVSDRKKADETQRLLVGELKHRVKNTLSTIQALATQTLHSVSAKEKDAFIERLRALSNAHDVIAQSSWHRAPLRDLVRQALEPFQIERIMISGPHVLIDSTKILSLTMSLHELATNAVKYGALSNDLGTVSILWKVREDASGRCVQLFWQESGGPLVSPPTRKGFGSRLLQVSLDAARLEFRPEGLGCALELSLG